MDHILTLDLKDLDIFHPKNARAIAFFLSDTERNTAYEPFTDEVKVVFLSEQDLKKGEYKGNLPKKMPKKASTFEIIPIKVGEEEFAIANKVFTQEGASMDRVADLALFLATDMSRGITGKLISAVWDDWEDWPEHVNELSSSDVYTLRRITRPDRRLP